MAGVSLPHFGARSEGGAAALAKPGAARHGLTVEHVAADDWDAIAVQFRDVIHEQTECFNAARWKPTQLRRLVFRSDDEIVGAVVARVVRVPLTGVDLVAVRYGPLWRRVGHPDQPGYLSRIYVAMAEELADKSGACLIVMPRSDAETSETDAQMLAAAGYKPLPQEPSPERYFVNVTLEPDAIRKSLAQKWRYNLKKAESNGLTTEFVPGPDGLKIFRDLYDAMLERKAFHDFSPVGTLDSLMTAQFAELRPLIVVVRKDGAPVAAGVIDCSGERAIYLYGATNRAALSLKAGYVMQWAVIEHLTGLTKTRWYDLGGGSSPTCSLHQFKRGLAGREGVVNEIPPEHVYAGSQWAWLVGHAALAAREAKDRIVTDLHARLKGWSRS